MLGCGGTMTLAKGFNNQWQWVCAKCGKIDIKKG
jgi:hypothetical protein